MVCAFRDYVSLYPDLSEVILVIDPNKKFRLIDYNKELGKPFSKFICVSSETNNKTKTKGNMTCFRETFINNEADRNNDSDYTEATTNDHITSVPLLFNNVFKNDSNVQLSADSNCSWEKNIRNIKNHSELINLLKLRYDEKIKVFAVTFNAKSVV